MQQLGSDPCNSRHSGATLTHAWVDRFVAPINCYRLLYHHLLLLSGDLAAEASLEMSTMYCKQKHRHEH